MRFAPHTALPRVKGVHQPRDSAVLFSKQTATATSNREWAQAVKGGEGRAAVRRTPHSRSALPVPARLCTTAVRRNKTRTPNDTKETPKCSTDDDSHAR